jgi:hypothetical protein
MEYCEIMLLIKSSIYNWKYSPTSPLNTAIVIEEVYREYSDRKAPFYLALLDTKSVFDVVDIDILMRKLFLLGVQPSTRKIIDELHHNTKTCVKAKLSKMELFCQSTLYIPLLWRRWH